MMYDLEPFSSQDDEIPEGEDEQKEPKVLRGRVWLSKDGYGWRLGGVNLNQFLARYHGRKLALVIAPINTASRAERDLYICHTCGFPLDDLGECLRCQWYGLVQARQRREELFQEIDRIVEQSWTEPHT